MSNRKRNRAVVCTNASAEATEDSKGNRTVTIKGTFAYDGYSQTNTLHLSQEAAEYLLRSLQGAV